MIYEFFPAEYIALQAELATGCHPKLELVLATCLPDDIDLRLAHIAAYCSIEMDGVYTLEARMKICAMCTWILREKLRENPNPVIHIDSSQHAEPNPFVYEDVAAGDPELPKKKLN